MLNGGSQLKNPNGSEEGTLRVKPFEQSKAMCGPAALKILLSYFKKEFSEEQLAGLADATIEDGVEHEGLIQAVKSLDAYVFSKDNGTLDELRYFIKEEKLPVIIGWFDTVNKGRPGDHYSVVVNVTDKNVIIVDPATNEPERWLAIENFPGIWFDFIGKDNNIVSWGWYMVVTFERKKFKIKGGHYY